MATKTGTFFLRRATGGAGGGHVEFEGPQRLAFGDVELAADTQSVAPSRHHTAGTKSDCSHCT